MNIYKSKIFLSAGVLSVFFTLFSTVKSQEILFQYNYKLDLSNATEAPKISGAPAIDYPEAARKNGVEGTVKVSLTLAENGTVKDINVLQGLPFGVSEAVAKGLQTLYFEPAKRGDQPIPVKMFFDYTVSAAYTEDNKNVSKPKIIEKPEAVYPETLRAEGAKGKVQVTVMFHDDGTLEVLGVSSVMPKEFDRAAAEAAKKIKFEPAVHKKSKKKVSQQMVVEYSFKP